MGEKMSAGAIVLFVIAIFVMLFVLSVVFFQIKRKKEQSIFGTQLEEYDVIVQGGKSVQQEGREKNITRGFMDIGEDIEKTILLSQKKTAAQEFIEAEQTALLNGQEKKWSIELRDKKSNHIFTKQFSDELVIGRVENSQYKNFIVINYDQSISKIHCRIFIKMGQIYIEDLDSANHTYLNGIKIEEHKLKEGDVLKIGKTEFDVVIQNLDVYKKGCLS